jgi:hypothetical protein
LSFAAGELAGWNCRLELNGAPPASNEIDRGGRPAVTRVSAARE